MPIFNRALFLTLLILCSTNSLAQQYALQCSPLQRQSPYGDPLESISDVERETIQRLTLEYYYVLDSLYSMEDVENEAHNHSAYLSTLETLKKSPELTQDEMDARRKHHEQIKIAQHEQYAKITDPLAMRTHEIQYFQNSGVQRAYSDMYFAMWDPIDYRQTLEDFLAKEVLKHSQFQQKVLPVEDQLKRIVPPLTNTDRIRLHIKRLLQHVKKRASFRDCGLSDFELYSIWMYTAYEYHNINQALRSNDKNLLDQYRLMIQSIQSGLEKLDNYVGAVNRGSGLPPEHLAEHCQNCVVTYKGFTSTSLGKGFPMEHQFLIHSKTGKYIAPLAKNTSEEEVLFPAPRKFQILNIQPHGKHYFRFEMTEL